MLTACHPAFVAPQYTPHPLHLDPDNDWIDANCYTDLWIELLHGLGLDPYPMLAFTLGIDFEGDQWTFFKPPAADLRHLYGIELIELAVYRSLAEHARTQLDRGRVPVLEADAYFLTDVPDTYRRQHTKTTVAVVAIDETARLARCLHNSTCVSVSGEDYDGLFRLAAHAPGPETLPPYVEVAKLSGLRVRGRPYLASAARELAAAYSGSPDTTTAMTRFLPTFDDEIRRVAAGGPPDFDGYAFATLRQLGAACTLAVRFLRWLDAGGFTEVVEGLQTVSRCAKRLILKAARSVSTGRALDASQTYAEMTGAWSRISEDLPAVRPAGAGPVRAGDGGEYGR